MATYTSNMMLSKKFKQNYLFIIVIWHYFVVSCLPEVSSHTTYVFSPDDIFEIVDKSCFVGISLVVNDETMPMAQLEMLNTAFRDERMVQIGNVDLKNFVWKSGKDLKFKDSDDEPSKIEIVLFPRRTIDRTCLLTGLHKSDPVAVVYRSTHNTHTLLDFINSKCNTYSTATGSLTMDGLHRNHILDNLFHVSNITDVSIRKLYDSAADQLHTCSTGTCNHEQEIHSYSSTSYTENDQHLHKKHYLNTLNMHQCDRISSSSISKEVFFHNYLKISKPVIITGAMDSWKAISKWTQQFFRDNYGSQKLHIKLTPDAEFEGVSLAHLFDNYNTFSIPKAVKDQLKFPDLVVVRPATAKMNMSTFLDVIESVSTGKRQGFSAYLEYSSIASLFPELMEDTEEMPFFKNMLKLQHANLWMSDGNTLGKLHFDPYDNFLCQISGKKEVILFEPCDNSRLYEAHIPEAQLSYSVTDKTFRKATLMDSTSMVMSPVDILKPDIKRFPKFLDTFPVNCTISDGEVLFMPSFWWHEVQSYPNLEQGRNIAVNFWYEPFLTREFPCEECKLDVNPKYRHLL